MDIASHAVSVHPAPGPRSPLAEAELATLRAQLAWLEAERVALWWAVGHDELTGLPNRRLLYSLAPPLLQAGPGSAVLVLLDLNGFKPINDRYGHDTGDAVLKVVAERLHHCAGDALVARFGGDEFVAVLTSPSAQSSDQWWRRRVSAMSAVIAEPMPLGGRVFQVSASIGVAPACGDAAIEELLRRADMAMYRAKATNTPYVVWGAGILDGHDAVGRGGAPGASGGGPSIPDGAVSRVDAASPAGAVAPTSGAPAPDRSATAVEFTVFPAQRAAPAGDPADLADPARDGMVAATLDVDRVLRRGAAVWVHRHGHWRPGVVVSSSERAVTVIYRYGDGPGTAADTVCPQYVLPRDRAFGEPVPGTLPVDLAA